MDYIESWVTRFGDSGLVDNAIASVPAYRKGRVEQVILRRFFEIWNVNKKVEEA
jgi:hypothetical protein